MVSACFSNKQQFIFLCGGSIDFNTFTQLFRYAQLLEHLENLNSKSMLITEKGIFIADMIR